MTRKQFIQRAASTLRRRRDALRRTVYGEFSRLNTSEERAVGDLGDAAVDHDYSQITSNLAELESRELARIERALERLQAGQYGMCEECQRAIPLARLQAIPYATTCVKCQQASESGNLASHPAEHWSRVVDLSEDEAEPLVIELAA